MIGFSVAIVAEGGGILLIRELRGRIALHKVVGAAVARSEVGSGDPLGVEGEDLAYRAEVYHGFAIAIAGAGAVSLSVPASEVVAGASKGRRTERLGEGAS